MSPHHISRNKRLIEVVQCPIKKIPYKRLNKKELNFVLTFIDNNRDLSDRDFKGKAHYLFIDGKDGRDNYPHHIEIIEVLMSICACE